MLKLILPEEKYWRSFQKGLQEFKDAASPYDIKEVKSAFAFKNFTDYKCDCENKRLGNNLLPNHVSSTSLWLIHNEKFIGLFDVRHSLTEALKICGGHIAYAIVPSERRKGFAVEGLKLSCRYAHDFMSIRDVLVTCRETNIASYKTMKKVMIEFGGIEATPSIVDNYEEKRVWIRTQPRPLQIRPLAVAMIKKDNKVLALKGFDDEKNETFYRLIGGGIEFGEKGEDTIKREFMEELGFEPINIKYSQTVENIFIFNGHKGHEIVLVYEAELPKHLKDENIFYGQEAVIRDKFVEFVEICKNNRIYPEGIF